MRRRFSPQNVHPTTCLSLLAGLVLLLVFGSTTGRLDRRAGALLVSFYAVYLVVVLAA